MTFNKLSKYLEQLEQTASSNDMILLTADFLKELSTNEVKPAMYLILGRLGPLYNNTEFGLSDKLAARAVADAFNMELDEVVSKYKTVGDLGDVVLTVGNKKSSNLSIVGVYDMLLEIAQTSGEGSIEKKISMLSGLLNKLDQSEGKYVIRIILERLRTGLAEAKVLDALSWAQIGDKSFRKEVEAAYNVFPDIGEIATIIMSDGIQGLEKIMITPGVPIRPAQAERLPTPEAIVEKLGRFMVQPKMDGFRVQIHLFENDGEKQVKLYSRNLNETTHMFPDIIEAVKELPIENGIFDSEALAFNPDTDEFLPFQETVKRRRKHDIESMQEKVPLKVFLFDTLYLDNKSYLNATGEERFCALETIDYSKQEVCIVTRNDLVDSGEELKQLFDLYVSEGLEGIMCKKLDAEYQAGSRNYNWVKYKRATEQALLDTVDVVVLGYYVGQGQRNKFGIGAFLVGVYDEDSGTFQSLAKIGTGLSDTQWKDMKERLDVVASPSKPNEYDVHANLSPDVWTFPKVVVEVAADEITKSPIHTAAKGADSLEESGLALRFPRLVRVREDKDPFESTSDNELLVMYQA